MIIVTVILYLLSPLFNPLIIFFCHYHALLICYKKYRNYGKYDIFFNLRFTEKNDISANCGKSRKYDIYIERFHENAVFHAV